MLYSIIGLIILILDIIMIIDVIKKSWDLVKKIIWILIILILPLLGLILYWFIGKKS